MGESAVADAGAEGGASKPHLKTHAHTHYQNKMMSYISSMFRKLRTVDPRMAEAQVLFEEKYKRPFSDLTSHYDKYPNELLETRNLYYYANDNETYIYNPNKRIWYTEEELNMRMQARRQALANRT